MTRYIADFRIFASRRPGLHRELHPYMSFESEPLTSLSDDGSALTTSNFVNRGHLLIYKDNYFRSDYDNIAIVGARGWQALANAPSDFVTMVKLICLEALPAYFDREESSVSIGGVSQAFLVGVISRNTLIQSTWLKYRGVTCA